MDSCSECGFVYDDVALDAVGAAVSGAADRLAATLEAADGLQRTRPGPKVWSALEYACHLRDVFEVQRQRLERALTEDTPVFAPMGRDERAVTERYNAQDVAAVASQLRSGAAGFAADLTTLDEAQWRRRGVYNWPEPAPRTMAWLARHTLHEAVHHLQDVERGLAALRSGASRGRAPAGDRRGTPRPRSPRGRPAPGTS